jgi:hypothetical protein
MGSKEAGGSFSAMISELEREPVLDPASLPEAEHAASASEAAAAADRTRHRRRLGGAGRAGAARLDSEGMETCLCCL